VALGRGLTRAVGHVRHRAQRLHAEVLPVLDPIRRAVRPVDALTLAVRPAHQPPHGNAERLAREIPQRQLDAGDGLLRGAVRRLADRAVQIEIELLDRGGILADEARAEILDEPDQPAREALAPELAVAGEALVGADGAEVPWARRLEPSV